MGKLGGTCRRRRVLGDCVIDMGGAGLKSDGERESLRRQAIHLQCQR